MLLHKNGGKQNMKKSIFAKLVFLALFATTVYSQSEYTEADLVWSDDFNGSN